MDKIIADTVAVAIHGIGFTPTSSVVLMLMNDHTLAATLRIDARPETPAGSWAAEITNYVHRLDTVNGILLLSFEDEHAMTPVQYHECAHILQYRAYAYDFAKLDRRVNAVYGKPRTVPAARAVRRNRFLEKPQGRAGLENSKPTRPCGRRSSLTG
ncbi:hypothetical protein [Paeniglutamicibacter sp. NPDC091659]|uniref:hypothetical protein n=1 Tax=Paeniglutamicibacter sp. NPDC091659 TaxID=3364389 RepID=UPI00381A6982